MIRVWEQHLEAKVFCVAIVSHGIELTWRGVVCHTVFAFPSPLCASLYPSAVVLAAYIDSHPEVVASLFIVETPNTGLPPTLSFWFRPRHYIGDTSRIHTTVGWK